MSAAGQSEMYLTSGSERIAYYAIITKRKKRRKGAGHKKDGAYDLIDVFDQYDDEQPHETYIAFATNDPKIDVEQYARRWGIETGCRMIESARPRTRSTNEEARTFCFLYATIMYNAWVILNIAEAIKDQATFQKWDGTPLITQIRMRLRMLLYIFSAIIGTSDNPPESEPPPDDNMQFTKIPSD